VGDNFWTYHKTKQKDGRRGPRSRCESCKRPAVERKLSSLRWCPECEKRVRPKEERL
jgi:hypothetical protein